MVGFPGSGKSHFAEQHVLQSNYEVINRDSLGTWQKCIAAAERSLEAGKSVLIDNTHPDKESRARFIQLATARGLPCRCFVMNTSMVHSRHNNKVLAPCNIDDPVCGRKHKFEREIVSLRATRTAPVVKECA